MSATLKLAQLANGSSRLADLLAEGQSSVRSDPANAKRRVMLFQLMVLGGQWARAPTQLYVIRGWARAPAAFARTSGEVARRERSPRGCLGGARTPGGLGEPQEWIANLSE